MLNKEELKRFALSVGADDVGIGDLSLFKGAPFEMDPRFFFPEARSIIGLIFRIPRGYIRGTEEGTNFYQYPSLGYGGINEIAAPTVIYEIGKYIEDQGYEAAVFRNTGGRGVLSDMTGARGRELSPELHTEGKSLNSETTPVERSLETRAVAEGRPAPDVFIHFRIAAYICGLGEIGYSKMFLSRKFGPLNRQVFILTDAEIEPDEIYSGPELCNRCMACVAACPGGCISRDREESVEIGGKKIAWGEIDEWSCFAYYIGSALGSNPFIDEAVYDSIDEGAKLKAGKLEITPDMYPKINGLINSYYQQDTHGYNPPKCGGCLRACFTSMEKRSVLQNSYKNRFRNRKVWKRNPDMENKK